MKKKSFHMAHNDTLNFEVVMLPYMVTHRMLHD